MAAKSASVLGGISGPSVLRKMMTSSGSPGLMLLITWLVAVGSVMGLAGGVSRGGLQSEDSAPPNKVQKCREGCLEKVRGSLFLISLIIVK